jgi:hypothetical protein
MFVKVFSRILEKKIESCLVDLHKLLVVEQKGQVVIYRFPNNECHKVYFPTQAEASKSLESFEKKHESPPPQLHRQRWDMPVPDLESMAMIQYYEDSTNTKRLQ